jgi:hypothetical protein
MRRFFQANGFWALGMFLATIVWLIGIVAVAGHILCIIRLYRWWGPVPMAFNTALNFALSGLATCFLGESIRRRRR